MKLLDKLAKGKKLRGMLDLGGYAIMFIIIVLIISMAVLLGGIFQRTINTIFTQQAVDSSWTNLSNTAFNYAQTGISLLTIGLIIFAFVAILGIVMLLRYIAGGSAAA